MRAVNRYSATIWMRSLKISPKLPALSADLSRRRQKAASRAKVGWPDREVPKAAYGVSRHRARRTQSSGVARSRPSTSISCRRFRRALGGAAEIEEASITYYDARTLSAFRRWPWNEGRLIGEKRPLKPKEVWAIRVRLRAWNRDLALLNLAIDSKLRACDLRLAPDR